MGFFIFLLCGFCIVTAIALLEYQDEKMDKEVRKNHIQGRITEDFEDIIDLAPRFGNEYYESLMDFAKKMDKMVSLKSDLKPYDAYYHKRLYENKASHMASKFLGRIVIDKNLVPKFMASGQSNIPSRCDIELEVALTSDGVRELAEKCRKLKMNSDIENFRKDKVRKALDGK